jgi:hypothetical protein
LGGRKPVAFPQKKVRHQRVMDNRLLLYTCQRKQTEYKRKKKTDKLIIFSKGPPPFVQKQLPVSHGNQDITSPNRLTIY